MAEASKEQLDELEAVKQEIADMKQEIADVKARVKELENKAERNAEEEKELEHKRPYLTALLANLSDLRKEKARLEERLQKSRDVAGTSLFIYLFICLYSSWLQRNWVQPWADYL